MFRTLGWGADGTFSGRWDRKNSMCKAWRNKTPVFPSSVAQSQRTALKGRGWRDEQWA